MPLPFRSLETGLAAFLTLVVAANLRAQTCLATISDMLPGQSKQIVQVFNGSSPYHRCFNFNQLTTGRWNGMAIVTWDTTNPDSNWNLSLGNNASVALSDASSETAVDFVLADGNVGAIPLPGGQADGRFTPGPGFPSSGGSNGIAKHANTSVTGGLPYAQAHSWSAVTSNANALNHTVMRIFEITLTGGRFYSVGVASSLPIKWHLFAPRSSPNWFARTDGQALATGTAVSPLAASLVSAPVTGVYAIVVFQDLEVSGQNSGNYTVSVADASFSVSSITPATIVAANSTFAGVAINGANFSAGSYLRWTRFGSSQVVTTTATSLSATLITFDVPASVRSMAGSGEWSVVHPNGTPSSGLPMTIENPLPGPGNVTPTLAAANGATLPVVINGSAIADGALARVATGSMTNDIPCAVSPGGTSASFTLPGSYTVSPGTVSVSIVNPGPGGGTRSVGSIEIAAPPAILSVNPSSIPRFSNPANLVIAGSGFRAGCSVRFTRGTTVWNSGPTSIFLSNLSVQAPFGIADQAGPVSVQVIHPITGSSNLGTLTITNPAPLWTATSPTCLQPTPNGATITISGQNFVAESEVRIGGQVVSNAVITPSLITVNLNSTYTQFAQVLSFSVVNPGPGGGTVAAGTVMIEAVMTLSSATPSTLPAGSSSTGIQFVGSGFTAATVLEVGFGSGPPIILAPSQWTATTLSVDFPASLLACPGTLSIVAKSTNSAFCGTASNPITVSLVPPILVSASPSVLAPLNATSMGPFIVLVGSGFLPTAPGFFVGVNGATLDFQGGGVISASATSVTLRVSPAISGALSRGALAISVANGACAVSNTIAVPLEPSPDVRDNQGTIRTEPLAFSPGDPLSVILEGCAANQAYTLVYELGIPAISGNYGGTSPCPVQVLGPQNSCFVLQGFGPASVPIVDGVGLYGPANPLGITVLSSAGTAPGGEVRLPTGVVAPNPPLNITVTLQAVYLDPNAPDGWRLTWARSINL